MSKLTPRLQFPYPSEGEQPFFSVFEAGELAKDSAHWSHGANNNLVFSEGGTFTWNAGTSTLTWTADIKVLSFSTDYFITIPPQSLIIADGQVTFFKVIRLLETATTATIDTGSRIEKSGVKNFDLQQFAARRGTTLYFPRGLSLLTGDSGSLFGTGLPGGGPPTGAAGGDLASNYPNPEVAAITALEAGALDNVIKNDGAGGWVIGVPPGGAPSGAAGGDLTGSTYPNPVIANNIVTNAKAADVPTGRLKGRVTALTGDPEDLTGTQATTLLDPFTSALKGVAPASGGGTANFLRADGTWVAPGGGPPTGAASGELGGSYPSPTVNDGADATAIHDNTAGEINAIAVKLSPVANDILLIEDFAAGNAKKKITIGTLPGGGAGNWDTVLTAGATTGANDPVIDTGRKLLGAAELTLEAGAGANATTVTGGAGSTSNGGAMVLAGGAADANNIGGAASFTGGAGSGSGTGGAASLVSGAAGPTGSSGSIDITTKPGGSTSGNSGDITLEIGDVTTGIIGDINIGATRATRVNLGTSGATQDINLGTGAASKNVRIGNASAPTLVEINAGFIDVNAGLSGVDVDAGGLIDLRSSKSGTAISLNASAIGAGDIVINAADLLDSGFT